MSYLNTSQALATVSPCTALEVKAVMCSDDSFADSNPASNVSTNSRYPPNPGRPLSPLRLSASVCGA